MVIRCILFDYDGVFTLDDYTPVIEAFHKSSGISKLQIKKIIGEHERRWVVASEATQFLLDLKKEFNFLGGVEEVATFLNQRGDTGLFEELPKFEAKGLKISILSNQIAYRVPHVRRELDKRLGLSRFQKIYFSPEMGLQKPFVGVNQNSESEMDISGKNIFPIVVKDMQSLGYHPDECVFIDDSLANIVSAQKYGIKGIKFEGIYQMKRELSKNYGINLESYSPPQ